MVDTQNRQCPDEGDRPRGVWLRRYTPDAALALARHAAEGDTQRQVAFCPAHWLALTDGRKVYVRAYLPRRRSTP